MKMSKLFPRVIRKEMADNTYRPRRRELRGQAFGKARNIARSHAQERRMS